MCFLQVFEFIFRIESSYTHHLAIQQKFWHHSCLNWATSAYEQDLHAWHSSNQKIKITAKHFKYLLPQTTNHHSEAKNWEAQFRWKNKSKIKKY